MPKTNKATGIEKRIGIIMTKGKVIMAIKRNVSSILYLFFFKFYSSNPSHLKNPQRLKRNRRDYKITLPTNLTLCEVIIIHIFRVPSPFLLTLHHYSLELFGLLQGYKSVCILFRK